MKRILLFYVLFFMVSFVSCDAHIETPDTGLQVGHVLCTDGTLLSLGEYRNRGKEAIAVVFYVNDGNDLPGDGYAVYLKDVAPQAYADSLGVKQGTSAQTDAYDGNENTFALASGQEVFSPMASSVFSIWENGQSAFVPSVAEMRLLYSVKSIIDPIIESLGGDPLSSGSCWYWSSTEVKGQEKLKAWLYSLGSGSILETPKIQAHKVRPVVILNR